VKARLTTPINIIHGSSPTITAVIEQNKISYWGLADAKLLSACLRSKVITDNTVPRGIVTPRENIEISAMIDTNDSDLSF
jgi:hypothetical protein